MMTATLGGVDITQWCQRIAHQPELNLRSYAEVSVPSELVSFAEGADELVITEGGTKHAGRAYYGEDTGDADDKMSVVQSYGPLVWFDRMQVMDADGDYSDPSIIADNLNAVDIMAAAINNWIAVEGGLDLAVGTTAGGGVPLIGYKPTDWPMTIEALREFLVNTGQLDLVVNHAAGGSSTVDLYNGDYGSDLSGSVALQYGMGAFNCVGAKYTFDFAKTVSRIRYFLGPKRPQFDGDIQHWAGDVQIDDPDLPDPPQSTIDGLSSSVEAMLGLLRRIEIYDANGDENALRDLYFRIWQSDALINMRPRRLLTVTPEPGISPSFTCGDTITGGAALRDTISGAQRVYSYRAEQDVEGNVQLVSVTTSADQEA